MRKEYLGDSFEESTRRLAELAERLQGTPASPMKARSGLPATSSMAMNAVLSTTPTS